MKQLNETGKYTVSRPSRPASGRISTAASARGHTSQTIAQVWKDYGYLIDPHTAVAYHVMEGYRKATGDDRTTVFVSTASPFKFCDSVLHSLGVDQVEEGLGALDQLEKVSGRPAPVPLASLRDQGRALHRERGQGPDDGRGAGDAPLRKGEGRGTVYHR